MNIAMMASVVIGDQLQRSYKPYSYSQGAGLTVTSRGGRDRT